MGAPPAGLGVPGTGPGAGTGRVDGVLFDIDDTLVDTRGAFRRALTGVIAAYLPHLPAERHSEVLTVWRADSNGYFRSYADGTMGMVAQRMARANQMQEVFGGATLDAAAFPAWDALFESGLQGAWAAHDDATGVVEELRAAGIAVGALSNAPVAYQVRKLERAGLETVPLLVGLDTLGFGKPDPRVFLEACRLLGTDPGRTAYIGDELDIDAQAAAGAGLVGIWLDRPGSRRAEISPADVAASGVPVVQGLGGLWGALGL